MRRSDTNRRAWTARGSMGWQTLLADLSLILFMVTAAAMADPPKPTANAIAATLTPPPSAKALADPARAEPLAIWIDRPGMPSLRDWLAAQAPDSRQQMTIIARYAKGGAPKALARAQALAGEAGAIGAAARIIIEPDQGAGSELRVSLAYDLAQAAAN